MATEGGDASATERAWESEVRSGEGAVIDGERRGLFIGPGEERRGGELSNDR
jgi:hypothetical protein